MYRQHSKTLYTRTHSHSSIHKHAVSDYNQLGSATITIETSTDGVTTLSHLNLSGYVGHVTIFS